MIALLCALVAGYGGRIAVEAPGAIASLDPAYAWTEAERVALLLLHEPPASLLEGPPQPEGARVRLRLRSGLQFHDGSAVDAAAASRSLQRLLQPSRARPPLCPFPRGEARAAGPLEVEVRLFELKPPLEAALHQHCAAFLPAREPPAAAPVPGTGPFAFLSRDGVGLRATAYAGHVLGAPLLSEIRIVSPTARLPGEVAALPRVTWRGRRTVFLVVNPQRAEAPALAAFAASLDRADLLMLVRSPATPIAATHPPGAPPLPLRAAPALIAHDAAEPDHRAVAQRLQLRLHDTGYAARVVAEPLADLLARLRAGDYDAALVSPPEPPVLPIVAGVDAARSAVPLYDETPRTELPPSVHGTAFADLWVYPP